MTAGSSMQLARKRVSHLRIDTNLSGSEDCDDVEAIGGADLEAEASSLLSAPSSHSHASSDMSNNTSYSNSRMTSEADRVLVDMNSSSHVELQSTGSHRIIQSEVSETASEETSGRGLFYNPDSLRRQELAELRSSHSESSVEANNEPSPRGRRFLHDSESESEGRFSIQSSRATSSAGTAMSSEYLSEDSWVAPSLQHHSTTSTNFADKSESSLKISRQTSTVSSVDSWREVVLDRDDSSVTPGTPKKTKSVRFSLENSRNSSDQFWGT